MASEDPLTIDMPEPYLLEAIDLHIKNLLSLSGRHFVSVEERLTHARQSLTWLTRIAEAPDRYDFYDVLCWQSQFELALDIPELAAPAARLLGLIGSPGSQRALVSMASENARPLDERRAAAEALRLAVAHRGVLLTTNEILRQYDRYNQSRGLDKETQNILGSILDTLESRSRGKIES